jgi:hypothetical protein
VTPDKIIWVRPRDPWMTNRAVVQPNPIVAFGVVADTMTAAASAESLDDLFLRLEDAGIMLRIDRSVLPTMAKTPTLASWELDLLRTVDNVVRLGHVKRVDRGEIVLENGSVSLPPGSVIVHCAASGLQYPPLVPIWGPDAITLQPIRSGFPCFGAALAGYVTARVDDDAERNRLCPPAPLSNTPPDWAEMQVLGNKSSMAFGSDPDIKQWANTVSLNPARVPAERQDDDEVKAVAERLKTSMPPGMQRLAELARMP